MSIEDICPSQFVGPSRAVFGREMNGQTGIALPRAFNEEPKITLHSVLAHHLPSNYLASTSSLLESTMDAAQFSCIRQVNRIRRRVGIDNIGAVRGAQKIRQTRDPTRPHWVGSLMLLGLFRV